MIDSAPVLNDGNPRPPEKSNVVATDPAGLLETYRLPADLNLFQIGMGDRAVTVRSQQVRALNLAWALLETSTIRKTERTSVAVIGAGFAGLTFAAALLQKETPCDITIFERRDSVLPLQQGSDSRWLHPHIYDWPREGSDSPSAELPVLNWTAARASDVAVQVRSEWADLSSHAEAEKPTKPTVALFCNTRQLRVGNDDDGSVGLKIEWVGQEREPFTPTVVRSADARKGQEKSFDVVVLAMGFGLERNGATPYWRNEALAQPGLEASRTAYVVSGTGDGGWIDLFRLRIADYRQDRILGELFEGQVELFTTLQAAAANLSDGQAAIDTVARIWAQSDGSLRTSAEKVTQRLRERLRHDTSVVLHTRRHVGFREVFRGTSQRVSFQNQLLAWILWSVGGFELADADKPIDLARREGVDERSIVYRNGTEPLEELRKALSDPLIEACGLPEPKPGVPASAAAGLRPQGDSIRWPGGYFWIPASRPKSQSESRKRSWRREYLPSSMQFAAATLCGALAGYLGRTAAPGKRLRITLHRKVSLGRDVYLQQCCGYYGVALNEEQRFDGVGRTFPVDDLTIGYAYRHESIVRTMEGTSGQALRADMTALKVGEDTTKMAGEVRSVLAIPILSSQPGDLPADVIGVLYLDSYEEDRFRDDEQLKAIVSIVEEHLDALAAERKGTGARGFSNAGWRSDGDGPAADAFREPSLVAMEEVPILPPVVMGLPRLNLDVSDFVLPGGD